MASGQWHRANGGLDYARSADGFMMLDPARTQTPEHSVVYAATLAQFKGIEETEKRVVLIWESGHCREEEAHRVH